MKIKIERDLHFPTARYLFLILLLWIPSYGQIGDENVFSPVPTVQRERLIERLNLLIASQRSEHWEEHYDMLSVLVTQGDTKQDYVKRLTTLFATGLGDTLIDFTPTIVTYQGGGPADVVILGCAKIRNNGRATELLASVDAYRESGDWFFSTIGVITPVDGKPASCKNLRSTCSSD